MEIEKMSDPFVNGVDGASIFADLDAIKANLEEIEDTEELLIRVPVRKPSKKWFVRVHPEYSLPVWLIEDDESKEQYLVLKSIHAELADYSRTYTLHLAVNRQGVHFLWPGPAVDPNGRSNDWHTAHRTAAETARKKWTQVVPDMSIGSYRVKVAKASWSDPEWRAETLTEILEIAFQDRIITDRNHPVAKQLLGLG
jgi:hypothetical protein